MRLIRIHTLSGKRYYTREINPVKDRLIFTDLFKDRMNTFSIHIGDIILLDSIDHDYSRIIKDDPDCCKP